MPQAFPKSKRKLVNLTLRIQPYDKKFPIN